MVGINKTSVYLIVHVVAKKLTAVGPHIQPSQGYRAPPFVRLVLEHANQIRETGLFEAINLPSRMVDSQAKSLLQMVWSLVDVASQIQASRTPAKRRRVCE